MMLLRHLQTRLNQFQIAASRLNTVRAFLLKNMQNINCCRKFYGIYGAISIAGMIFNDFENACSGVSFERFRGCRFSATLRDQESLSKPILHVFGHFANVFA